MHDAVSDFDFFFGRWTVRNKRLRERLAGSSTWDEFDGTALAWPVLGGQGNVNEYQAVSPGGPIQGLAVRLFDVRSQQWSIYWTTAGAGTLDLPPMVGSFRGGRGEFYNHETFAGRSIQVRFIWSGMGPDQCRWEQAFSADGGKTWETNWIMEFTRVAAASPAGAS